MNNKKTTPPAKQDSSLKLFSNFVVFQTENGKVNIDVFFQNDTLWLTQKKIAELFEKDRTVISRHLKNIFKEKELGENMVYANFVHTTQHGAIKGKPQTGRSKPHRLSDRWKLW